MKTQPIVNVLLILAALSGCKGGDKNEVAKIGDRTISQAEFNAYLELKRIPKDDARRKQVALDSYLEREALADAVAKQGKLDKALVAAEMREYEKELLINRHFDKFLGDTVNDQALRNYYSTNSEKYEESKVHVAHILFRLNPGMNEQERKAKLTAALDAYSKLKAGQDFAEIAAKVSEDKFSGKKGGDLGMLRKDSIDPRFAQKVYAMKQGELSEPFETSFGYHIVKLLEPAQSVKKPFESVQGDIRYELRAKAKEAEMNRLKAALKVERKAGAKSVTQARPNKTAETRQASK